MMGFHISKIYNEFELKKTQKESIKLLKSTYKIKTLTDATFLYVCLKKVDPEILKKADHPWYHELSLCIESKNLIPLNKEAVDYYTKELLTFGGFNSVMKYRKISPINIFLRRWNDEYKNFNLTDLVNKVEGEIRDGQAQEIFNFNFGNPVIGELMDDTISPKMSKDGITEIEKNYCKTNNVVCVFGYDEAGNLEKYFISKKHIDEKILVEVPEDDDKVPVCNICMCIEGLHFCTNEKCSFSSCAKCFHECQKLTSGGSCPFCKTPIEQL